jgi:hypothetical protein
MESEEFDCAVAATARRQADRLRGMGFHRAAAEVDAVLPAALAPTVTTPALTTAGSTADAAPVS